jgi:hypothetical protein
MKMSFVFYVYLLYVCYSVSGLVNCDNDSDFYVPWGIPYQGAASVPAADKASSKRY